MTFRTIKAFTTAYHHIKMFLYHNVSVFFLLISYSESQYRQNIYSYFPFKNLIQYFFLIERVRSVKVVDQYGIERSTLAGPYLEAETLNLTCFAIGGKAHFPEPIHLLNRSKCSLCFYSKFRFKGSVEQTHLGVAN